MDFLYALRAFDGFWYYFTAVLCVIFIMAIIGYLMERYQKSEGEEAIIGVQSKKREDLSTLKEAKEVTPTSVENIMKPVTPSVVDFSAPGVLEKQPVNSVSTLEGDFSGTDVTPVIPDLVEENQVNPSQESTVSEPFILELNSSDTEKVPSSLEPPKNVN